MDDACVCEQMDGLSPGDVAALYDPLLGSPPPPHATYERLSLSTHDTHSGMFFSIHSLGSAWIQMFSLIIFLSHLRWQRDDHLLPERYHCPCSRTQTSSW